MLNEMNLLPQTFFCENNFNIDLIKETSSHLVFQNQLAEGCSAVFVYRYTELNDIDNIWLKCYLDGP
jgi:hypothetical protein